MKELVSAVIVAGGEGKRMKTDLPKQFIEVSGKPIIIHTLEKFCNSPRIDKVVVVCLKAYIEKLKGLVKRYALKKIHAIVPGEKTRQGSSYAGLKACPKETEYVLIHDAVRPFVTGSIIKEVLTQAMKTGASACAIDVVDTIIEVKRGILSGLPDRSSLMRIQTPQGFKYDIIQDAHENSIRNGMFDSTDDCGLVLREGCDVRVVKGSKDNIKITDDKDLFLAVDLLK
jgi:2-C-methyl-D-erythritol 4-phosphate cytidylyltransferase